MLNDLRDFIREAQALGEYKEVRGADPDVEIGGITELEAAKPDNRALVFDNVRGYPPGYRVASNLFTTLRRAALGLGLPVDISGIDVVKAFRERERGGVKPIPPIEVKDAPVKENVHVGDEVNLLEFPSPKWHELDGGRYIGTGAMSIIRDPDEGWVNLAAQRVQVHDRNVATIFMAPGRHPIIMRQKYWDRGKPCPAAVACGQEPLLWSSSYRRVPWGISEYDFTGGLRGAPVAVTRGVTTDLPIPATAEIVLEGEIALPNTDTVTEGPFGEWLGYYATGASRLPVFKVKSILHRHNPIIQGNPPSVLPPIWTVGLHIQKAAILWNDIDLQVPGVKGVWMMDTDACLSIPVISIKQEYEGHATAVGMVAAACVEVASWSANRFIIVVDDDIDPSNMGQVMWALATRTDPEQSIDIIRGFRSTTTDPIVSPEKRRRGEFSHSKAVIRAVKPYHWKKDFPVACRNSPETLRKIEAKWGDALK